MGQNHNTLPRHACMVGVILTFLLTLLDTSKVIAGGVPTSEGFTFSAPAALNSHSTTVNVNDGEVALATNRAGLWIAVWSAPGGRTLNGTGDIGATGPNGLNEDLFFARSMDNGITWSNTAKLKTTDATDRADDISPDIATDGKGNWVVVWRSMDSLNGTIGDDDDILVSYSNNDGLTWSPPAALSSEAATDSSSSIDAMPHIQTDGQGRWVAIWSVMNWNYKTSSVKVVTSSDNGAHWTNTSTLQQTNGFNYIFSHLATDRKGHWILTWDLPDPQGTDWDIFYSTSNNNGVSWITPQRLNSNGYSDNGNDNRPRLTCDGQGHWIAVWQSTENLGGINGTDNEILYSRSFNNGQTWSPPCLLNTDAMVDGTSVDNNPMIVTDGRGKWVTLWTTQVFGGDNDVVYSVSEDNGTNWSSPIPVYSGELTDSYVDGGINGGLHSLATDGRGHWVVAWSSNNPLGVKLMGYNILYSYVNLSTSVKAGDWTQYP